MEGWTKEENDFYRETGMFPPGRSVPAAMGGPDPLERNKAWLEWLEKRPKEGQQPMAKSMGKMNPHEAWKHLLATMPKDHLADQVRRETLQGCRATFEMLVELGRMRGDGYDHARRIADYAAELFEDEYRDA